MFRAALAAALVALAPLAAHAQAPITMKIGSPTVRSALEEWTAILKKNLEARTHGRIKVEGYPGSQLGAIPRMIEGAQLGTIEAVQVPADFLTGVDERFGVFSAPGLLKNVEHGRAVLNDPESKKAYWGIGQDKGIVILAHNCDTPTDFATRNPIHKMDDMKGLKIRIFGSPMEREMLRRIGATGVPMPLSEVLPAIQRHVIDGNKAGITVFVPFKYYDTVKYVWRAKESTLCVLKFASKMWMDRLASDLRTAVVEESLRAADAVMPFTLKIINQSYAGWKANGGTLTEFDDAEQKAFYARIASVGDDIYKDKPKARALYEIMKKVAARHERKM